MKKANTRGLELLEDARAKCIAAIDALDELADAGIDEPLVPLASSALSRLLLSASRIEERLNGSDGYDGPEYSKDAAEEDRELQREGDRLAGDRD